MAADRVGRRPTVERGDLPVASIERLELEAHRGAIARDVRHLVEKYRAIFDWDTPDIDQGEADRLILREVSLAIEAIRVELSGA